MSIAAFFCSCTSENSSSAVNDWRTNPSSIGTQVYANKVGSDEEGISCEVYEGTSSIVQSYTQTVLGIDITANTLVSLSNGDMVFSSYVETNPYNAAAMKKLCSNLKQQYSEKDQYATTVDCQDTYVITEGKLTGYNLTSDELNATKNSLIQQCQKNIQSFGTKNSSSSNSAPVASNGTNNDMPDTLYVNNTGNQSTVSCTIEMGSQSFEQIVTSGNQGLSSKISLTEIGLEMKATYIGFNEADWTDICESAMEGWTEEFTVSCVDNQVTIYSSAYTPANTSLAGILQEAEEECQDLNSGKMTFQQFIDD